MTIMMLPGIYIQKKYEQMWLEHFTDCEEEVEKSVVLLQVTHPSYLAPGASSAGPRREVQREEVMAGVRARRAR
eukprot:gene8736-biopygen21172